MLNHVTIAFVYDDTMRREEATLMTSQLEWTFAVEFHKLPIVETIPQH
jgi:hypothetical protein